LSSGGWREGKEGLLFVNKKKQKNFLSIGLGAGIGTVSRERAAFLLFRRQ
jgi:hypothetical protein